MRKKINEKERYELNEKDKENERENERNNKTNLMERTSQRMRMKKLKK